MDGGRGRACGVEADFSILTRTTSLAADHDQTTISRDRPSPLGTSCPKKRTRARQPRTVLSNFLRLRRPESQASCSALNERRPALYRTLSFFGGEGLYWWTQGQGPAPDRRDASRLGMCRSQTGKRRRRVPPILFQSVGFSRSVVVVVRIEGRGPLNHIRSLGLPGAVALAQSAKLATIGFVFRRRGGAGEIYAVRERARDTTGPHGGGCWGFFRRIYAGKSS